MQTNCSVMYVCEIYTNRPRSGGALGQAAPPPNFFESEKICSLIECVPFLTQNNAGLCTLVAMLRAYVKRVSQRSAESRGFPPGTSVSSHGEVDGAGSDKHRRVKKYCKDKQPK